jgi:hypothetical protein
VSERRRVKLSALESNAPESLDPGASVVTKWKGSVAAVAVL